MNRKRKRGRRYTPGVDESRQEDTLHSSTYFSIVGSAFAHLKSALRSKLLAPFRIVMWGLTWLPLATFCDWRMLPLSNRVVELIGYEGMTAEECDIRQSILRRRGKYDEAVICIRYALAKNSSSAHTRGLLHVGLADVYIRQKNMLGAIDELNKALSEAMLAEKDEPRQASRIYKYSAVIADCLGKKDEASKLHQKAQELAEATAAKDQLLKL